MEREFAYFRGEGPCGTCPGCGCREMVRWVGCNDCLSAASEARVFRDTRGDTNAMRDALYEYGRKKREAEKAKAAPTHGIAAWIPAFATMRDEVVRLVSTGQTPFRTYTEHDLARRLFDTDPRVVAFVARVTDGRNGVEAFEKAWGRDEQGWASEAKAIAARVFAS